MVSRRLLVAAFCFLLTALFAANHWFVSVDRFLLEQIQTLSSETADYLLYFFTLLGSIELSTFALLLICFLHYWMYRQPRIFWVVLIFFSLSLLEWVIKNTIPYVGPPDNLSRNPFRFGWIHVRTWYSFPSGHTFRSVFLLGVYGYFFAAQGFVFRRVQRGLLGSFILGISMSRIYLGDHWPLDVLGGLFLAWFGVELAACASATRQK